MMAGWKAAVFFFLFVAFGNAWPDPSPAADSAKVDREAASARDLCHLATEVTLVSAGAFTLGTALQYQPLLLLGAAGMYAGVPAIGIGSARLTRAAGFKHPEAETGSAALGWALYALGLGAFAGGTAWLLDNIEVVPDSIGSNTSRFKNSTTAYYAGGMMLGGALLDLAAWYQFWRNHRKAETLMAGFRAEPVLYLADKRIRGAGLRLAMNF